MEIDQLKALFSAGKYPTAANFASLIDTACGGVGNQINVNSFETITDENTNFYQYNGEYHISKIFLLLNDTAHSKTFFLPVFSGDVADFTIPAHHHAYVYIDAADISGVNSESIILFKSWSPAVILNFTSDMYGLNPDTDDDGNSFNYYNLSQDMGQSFPLIRFTDGNLVCITNGSSTPLRIYTNDSTDYVSVGGNSIGFALYFNDKLYSISGAIQ